MKKIHNPQLLALGLYPSTRGYGFAVFEGRSSLADWGAVTVKGGNKNGQCLVKIAALLAFYLPDVVVIEDIQAKDSHRSRRIQALIREIRHLTKRKHLTTRAYSRAQIRDSFAYGGAKNKYVIAQMIAEEFPELQSRCPPLRKPWMTEDYRIALFDAASLVLTYFDEAERKRMHLERGECL